MAETTIDPGTWPQFTVRLEADKADHPSLRGHYRVTTLRAPDEDAARAACERAEYRHAAFTAPDADRLEAIDADPRKQLDTGQLPRLLSHRQSKPYNIVKVDQTADPRR